MKVAVIGAGPSGLTTLKYLLTAHESLPVSPIEARLFETEAEIGGTFRHRTYEDAEVCFSSGDAPNVFTDATAQLVSSKQLTTFSDLRPRDSDPDFLPSDRYLEYLDDYATKFGLRAHIHLSSPVLHVRRHNGGHQITYRNGKDGGEETWDCDAIAVCSGLHVTPAIPTIPGIEHVPQAFHASEFKSRADFGVDKTVLILGSGETGMDVAYMAVTGNAKTKRVLMSHR
jgi:dimethylaniline monooxygenase (N-oxide forming)